MLSYLLDIASWLQPEATGNGDGAPTGGEGGRGLTGPDCLTQVGLLAVMVLVFYFLLIRPQRKREREREDMLKNLRKGQVVRTTGGLRGEITAIDEREATLQIADRVKVNVLRSHISGPDVPAEGEAKGKGKSAEQSSADSDDKGKEKD